MLTQREKDFIRYWEANRLRRKKVVRQFLIGIPMGLVIVIPIVINFSSGWYRRADMEANSPDFNPIVLFVALALIVGFTAIFYQRHQWDQYEQRYRELRTRLEKEEAAPTVQPPPPPASQPPNEGYSPPNDSHSPPKSE
ncbi:MAG TPA: hypothetical protein VG101_13185 [Puia sp.]|jgi:hypothetical protein|nr:hypothetical protein [Puia sp.]